VQKPHIELISATVIDGFGHHDHMNLSRFDCWNASSLYKTREPKVYSQCREGGVHDQQGDQIEVGDLLKKASHGG
jgi:hypothetical protein